MRKAWLAPLGALLALAIASLAAIGFVAWRQSEQQRALSVHTARCRSGERSGCDWLKTACTKRAGVACTHLAKLYVTGEGVTQSHAEALALAKEGCRLRDAAGCLLAAELSASDPDGAAEARELYERACRLGDPSGCQRAGEDSRKPR